MHQLQVSHIHNRRTFHNASSRASRNTPITSLLKTSSLTRPCFSSPTSSHLSSPFFGGGLSKLSSLAKTTTTASTICNSYAAPEVYDIAFSFRDFEAEVAFLLAAYQSHGNTGGGPLTRFLELGCGPARHSILLSQATGATCIGLDLSKEMLAYAAQQAKQAKLSEEKIKFIQGDMASPQGISSLVPGGHVDIAAIMLGTISHCLDNGAALTTFNNVAEVVRPGGVLVLELSHPGELFGGSFLDPLDFVDCWEVSEDGDVEFAEKRRSKFQHGDEIDPEQQAAAELEGQEEDFGEDDDDEFDDEDSESGNSTKLDGLRRVLVEYGRDGDDFDPATQILQRTVGLSLFSKQGELVSSDVSVVPQRQFSLQEIDLLARASGKWVVKAVYGDLDENVPLQAEDAYRMVVVLQRKD